MSLCMVMSSSVGGNMVTSKSDTELSFINDPRGRQIFEDCWLTMSEITALPRRWPTILVFSI